MKAHRHAIGAVCEPCLRDGEIRGLLRAARKAQYHVAPAWASGDEIADWCRDAAKRLKEDAK